MEYPKIQTLWKRDPENNFKIIEGNFSEQAFNSINRWTVTEKIDGMNIRIIKEPSGITFAGRTSNAQLPTRLMPCLENLRANVWEIFSGADKAILFGEGYGGKIQKAGKLYRKDEAFILFDAWIDGWWLEREKIADIALTLGLDVVQQVLCGPVSIDEAVSYLKSKPTSKIGISADTTQPMEGIVARSHPLMLFRDSRPIMWKLKIKDYEL